MDNIVTRLPLGSSSSAPLQRKLLTAARLETNADIAQLLMSMVRVVDRRTPGPMQAAAVEEVLNNLSSLAFRDELTGLLNRRGFMRQGEELLTRAKRTGQRAVLFFADVNNLKLVNDAAGHERGDELLASIGEILSASFRRGDALGRLGGDEFAAMTLCAPGGCYCSVRQRWEDVVRRANSKPGHPPVSLSVGVAYSSADRPQSLAALIRQADKCMYGIKYARGSDRAAQLGASPAPQLAFELPGTTPRSCSDCGTRVSS